MPSSSVEGSGRADIYESCKAGLFHTIAYHLRQMIDKKEGDNGKYNVADNMYAGATYALLKNYGFNPSVFTMTDGNNMVHMWTEVDGFIVDLNPSAILSPVNDPTGFVRSSISFAEIKKDSTLVIPIRSDQYKNFTTINKSYKIGEIYPNTVLWDDLLGRAIARARGYTLHGFGDWHAGILRGLKQGKYPSPQT